MYRIREQRVMAILALKQLEAEANKKRDLEDAAAMAEAAAAEAVDDSQADDGEEPAAADLDGTARAGA